MRALFATAELAPVAAVGGLAHAAAGLVAELRRQGVDVDVVMPDYGGVELAEERIERLPIVDWAAPCRIRSGTHPVVGPLRLVSVPGMARSHPYLQPSGEGWPDNTERFLAFSRAVAALANAAPPDVVHLNDWHTGAALAALDGSVPSVLSLHNLAYQGTAGGEWLDRIGPRAAHFEWYGGTNPLSGAIALADAIVAVSPTYAKEILTPTAGFGLDGPLRNRWAAVSGILNGIDTDVWDPQRDPALPVRYSADDEPEARRLAKLASRAVVLDRIGRASTWDDDRPLAVMVTRLTSQKGVDLLVPIVPILGEIPLRLVVLGSGEAGLAASLGRCAADHPDSFAFVEAYDDRLAHLLFAAGDLYLMPSRFEPCGLAQMQAMRYGTLPVVTDVGGLHDTVVDADGRRSRRGTGFTAVEPTAAAVTAALFRAARRLANRRQRDALVSRVMQIDWSWREPARRYVELYERLIAGRPSVS